MNNPFDDQDGAFVVLVNGERQYSLWPTFAERPAGWTVAHGVGTRADCVRWVDEHWTDMRPLSLARAMDGDDPGARTNGLAQAIDGGDPSA